MAFRFQEVSGNSFAVSKELPNLSCGFITFLISSCYYTLLSYHKTVGRGTAPLPFSIETPQLHSQRKNSLAKAGRESRLEENVLRIFGRASMEAAKYAQGTRAGTLGRAPVGNGCLSEAPLQRRAGSFIMNISARESWRNPGDGREEEE